MTESEKEEIRAIVRQELSIALKNKSKRGYATCIKYGHEELSRWGKLGGRPRKQIKGGNNENRSM